MKFPLTVNSENVLRKWPRVEEYQNSTLRYSPPSTFPAYAAKIIGRPKIIRTWVTLDEVWDYRTDTWNWDYPVGTPIYAEDKNHYRYDWGTSVPTGANFVSYLTTYCEQAEEVLFNIRRYEREVTDGIISYEQYENVVEKVIEHYKEIVPNIIYIECCNEVEGATFGGLTMEEYYKLYKITAAVVARLNEKHHYEKPLKIGGYAMAACMTHWNCWQQFLRLLAKDPTPIDFYSMHDYSHDIFRLLDFINRHRELCEELGLPDVPMFLNEYGAKIPQPRTAYTSLINASVIISGMILSSHLKNTYVFPWCTFHDPNRQICFTQFILREDGTFAPTPNGNAITALHMLETDEIEISENTEYKAVATKGNGKIVLLLTNPKDEPMEADININGNFSYKAKVTQYLCSDTVNNCLTGDNTDVYAPTSVEYVNTANDRKLLNLKINLEPRNFVLIVIE